MIEPAAAVADRGALLRRGRRLEILTVGWNFVEAIVAVGAGVVAGSVSLIGFGLDSVIESLSGAVLFWRLGKDDERREALARKLVAASFVLLALYVAAGSAQTLLANRPPEASPLGIAIAALSLAVMPILARAKRSVGHRLASSAMVSDSRQTDLCAVLSAILLAGLAANALAGWWWADPLAGLLMVPFIAWEARRAWRGEECGDCHVTYADR